MKLNNKRATSIFKKSETPFPTFDFSGSEDLIFIFEVKTGFVNATEQGIVFNSNVNTYSRFERIFTGFEAVSAIWKGSTFLSESLPLKKTYKAGAAQLWHFDSVESEDDFTDLAENTDFLKERVVKTATYFTKNKIYDEDILNLFIIPGKFNKTIFYIKSVEEFHKPGTQEYLYSKVVLHSLNDKLANTGLAIDQYVQFSAPGEGYAYPQLIPTITRKQRKELPTYASYADIPTTEIVEGAEFLITNYVDSDGVNQGEVVVLYRQLTNKVIITHATNGYIVNTTFLQNYPIVSAQLEIYSPSILTSVYAYGRPIGNGSSSQEEITVSRPLFIEKVNVPDLTQRDVTKPLSQNTSWYWIPRSRMEIESFYDNWVQKTQGNWNPAILKKWLGYLRVDAKDYGAPLTPLGARILADIFSGGLSELAFADEDKEVPGTGYWVFNNMQNLSSLFMRNFYIHKNTPRLPLDFRESIPWTLKDIPLIGGMLNKLSLGLPTGWKEQTETGGKNYNVSGLISQSLLDFYKNTFIGVKRTGTQSYTGLPFGAFSDETEQSSLSPGEFATILNFDLTDKWFKTSTNTEFAPPLGTGQALNTSTIGFGQKVTETSIPAKRDDTTAGYALDAFGFHALGSGTWKITLFAFVNGEKRAVFNGTYKTLSKLTNSIRDWNNNVKLSHWNSNIPFDTRTPNDPPTTLQLPNDIKQATNGMENAQLIAEYEFDKATKEILRDQFGNPIIKRDALGNEIFKLVPVPLDPYGRPVNLDTRTQIPNNPRNEKIVDDLTNDRISLTVDLNEKYRKQFQYLETNGFTEVSFSVGVEIKVDAIFNEPITSNFITNTINNNYKISDYFIFGKDKLVPDENKESYTFNSTLDVKGTLVNGQLQLISVTSKGNTLNIANITGFGQQLENIPTKQYQSQDQTRNIGTVIQTVSSLRFNVLLTWGGSYTVFYSNNDLTININMSKNSNVAYEIKQVSGFNIDTFRGAVSIPKNLYGFKKVIKMTFGDLTAKIK